MTTVVGLDDLQLVAKVVAAGVRIRSAQSGMRAAVTANFRQRARTSVCHGPDRVAAGAAPAWRSLPVLAARSRLPHATAADSAARAAVVVHARGVVYRFPAAGGKLGRGGTDYGSYTQPRSPPLHRAVRPMSRRRVARCQLAAGRIDVNLRRHAGTAG